MKNSWKRFMRRGILMSLIMVCMTTGAFAEGTSEMVQAISISQEEFILRFVMGIMIVVCFFIAIFSVIFAYKTKKKCDIKNRKYCEKNKSLEFALHDRDKRIKWLLENEHEIFKERHHSLELHDRLDAIIKELAEEKRLKSFWEARYHTLESDNKALIDSNNSLLKELAELREKVQEHGE